MTKIEFTGERFVPDKSPPRLEAEHRSRYEFAGRFMEGQRVLDIGCGEGYGSYMMIAFARSVVGVDINERAIRHAKEMYESTNLSFTAADVASLPFSDGEFTACVCFEVIEHIENPDAMLSEARRVLDPKGIFIVSTPNGAVRVSSRPNPFHAREFNLKGFRQLLEKYFPSDEWSMEILGQFQKGKAYSKSGVMLMNMYLGLKGSLGIRPREESSAGLSRPSEPKKPVSQYEFASTQAELAEYLIAVIQGRRQ